MVGMRTQLAIERAGLVTPHLKRGRARFLSQWHESESRKQAKADLKPPACGTPEGSVSTARWNPKGMRRLCQEDAKSVMLCER